MRVVKPKKFLGQHFLKDLKVAQDIADTVDVCPEIPILEVGPGMGVLTQFLLPKERNVKVVELDYESVAYLREAYPQLGKRTPRKGHEPEGPRRQETAGGTRRTAGRQVALRLQDVRSRPGASGT